MLLICLYFNQEQAIFIQGNSCSFLHKQKLATGHDEAAAENPEAVAQYENYLTARREACNKKKQEVRRESRTQRIATFPLTVRS